MSDYVLEMLNRIVLMLPAFFVGLSLGFNWGKKEK